MKIQLVKKPENKSILVFLLKEKEKIEKHPLFKFVNRRDQNFLRAFLKKSPLKSDHSHLVFTPTGAEVFLLGTFEKSKFNHRKAILAARRAISTARKERVKDITLNLHDFLSSDFNRGHEELGEIIATQCEMANFEFVRYKTPPSEGWIFLENVSIYAPDVHPGLAEAIRRGKIIGEEINKARELSNTPGGDMTPEKLAKAAAKSGKETGFKVKILGENEIKKLKMGGVLGVSKGSEERPRFIVMEYWGAASQKRGEPRHPKRGGREKPVVLVGKGVTFDTGGLNIKPSEAIYEMHMDMSGGAAVIHAIAALARLKVKKNVVGLVPAVENMPSGSSYHPGDQLKTMSGKTIEVLNTDAEGRVILADALTYAKKYHPQLVVDIATLTGAAMAALGQRASALLTPDQKFEAQFREVGEQTGDFVWPLPLWEEYEEDIKGTFGDVANTGKTKYGGAITAACFLWQFVKDSKGEDSYPWVHIDIAPRMTSIDSEFLAKGAAGASIALLVHFLRKI